jgi:hypothetical protein
VRALNRTTAFRTQPLKLETGFFKVIDTPGELVRGPARAAAEREILRAQPAFFINVVCHGYHESDVLTASEAVAEDGTARPEWLEKQRQIELADLDDWAGRLGATLRRARMLTVINKADLWWDEQATVLDHYTSGPYADRVKALGLRLVDPVPYCSIIKRFQGRGLTSGRFDDPCRAELRRTAIRSLLEMVANGVPHGD